MHKHRSCSSNDPEEDPDIDPEARAGCGWFTGWIDLKGMSNDFRPTEAPEEKPPFPDWQIVSELATALTALFTMEQVHWGGGSFRWGLQLGRRLGYGWAWSHIKSHPWLLWQTLWQPSLEQHVRDSFSFERRQKKCRSEKITFHSPCVTTGHSVYNPNSSMRITVF